MTAVFGNSRVALASVLLTGAALLVALTSGTAEAATGKHKTFTIYAVTTQVQYVNLADGITRGDNHNPFNADTKLLPPTKGKGALPGNNVFFSFKLYKDASLKQSIGTASYTCTFDFNQTATCDAFYDLMNGTLFASDPVDFTTTRSTLALIGGTSKYLGSGGEVVTLGPGTKPAAKNESRLDFVLLG